MLLARSAPHGAASLAVVVLLLWASGVGAQQPTPPRAEQAARASEGLPMEATDLIGDLRSGLAQAAVRLPLAALFGAALALRPRRAGLATARSRRDRNADRPRRSSAR